MWELDCEEGWVPKNWCFWTVVLEKTLECSLDGEEIQPVHSKGVQPWDYFGRNDAKAEAPVLWPPHVKIHWKRLWCWEELGAGGEGGDPGWDGWMASRTRWTWVWVNSGRWWWTGRPGMLRFMGSQRVGHDWTNELNWTENQLLLVLFLKAFFGYAWVIIIYFNTVFTRYLALPSSVIIYFYFPAWYFLYWLKWNKIKWRLCSLLTCYPCFFHSFATHSASAE